MAIKKFKAINNMPVGALGIILADGKSHVLRKPDAYKEITSEDAWHIFNSCKHIQKGYLFIDDKTMRIELGLEEDDAVDINAISKNELKDMIVACSVAELQNILNSDLSNGTIEKIVIIARSEYEKNSMDAKKVKLIENFTGMPIMEDDGSAVQEVNDVKPQIKVPKIKPILNK